MFRFVVIESYFLQCVILYQECLWRFYVFHQIFRDVLKSMPLLNCVISLFRGRNKNWKRSNLTWYFANCQRPKRCERGRAEKKSPPPKNFISRLVLRQLDEYIKWEILQTGNHLLVSFSASLQCLSKGKKGQTRKLVFLTGKTHFKVQ